MDLQLKRKCCVVTGGTRNLGRAITLSLLNEGAQVLATYLHDKASADKCVALTPIEHQPHLRVARLDAAHEPECRDACELAIQQFGRLDVLINNAAVTTVQSPQSITDVDFDHIMRNTLRSNIYMSRAAANVMKSLGGGRIVNMSTAGVYTANPNELLYLCAKAGVEAATRAFARDGAQHNVTVNAVAAHVIASGMGEQTMSADRTIIDRIPLHRMGRLDELVGLVVYLASPICEYMTGQIIHLNGGRLMH